MPSGGLPAFHHAPTARGVIATLAGTRRLSQVPSAIAGSTAQASPPKPVLALPPWGQEPGRDPAAPLHPVLPSALPPPWGRQQGQGGHCQPRRRREHDSHPCPGQPSGCREGVSPHR